MIRNFRWTEEAVWGTYDAGGVTYRFPMDVPNNFKLMTTRPMWSIRSGSGLNIPRVRGSAIVATAGQWSTRHYWETPTLPLWCNRIVGGTAPWTTAERVSDLASATIDFDYTYDDLTVKYFRYLGCKPGQNIKIDCANTPDNPFLNFTWDILAGQPIPNPDGIGTSLVIGTFPASTEGQIPKNPLTFQECVITGLGAPMTHVDRFSIAINNKIKPYYDGSKYPNRITMNGRDVTLTLHFHLQTATEMRYAFYEAVAALGEIKIVFTGPGTQTLTFEFRTKCYADNISEEFVLDEDAYTELTATAHLDSGTGDDFIISLTS